MKEYAIAYLIAVLISVAILVVYFSLGSFVSIDASRGFGNIFWWPIDNLIAGKEAQRQLTIFLFGRMTPNFAPIQLILYFATWSTLFFILIRLYKCKK